MLAHFSNSDKKSKIDFLQNIKSVRTCAIMYLSGLMKFNTEVLFSTQLFPHDFHLHVLNISFPLDHFALCLLKKAGEVYTFFFQNS